MIYFAVTINAAGTEDKNAEGFLSRADALNWFCKQIHDGSARDGWIEESGIPVIDFIEITKYCASNSN